MALKEITNTSKVMKEMQYRIDVLEEFFQLNVVPVEVSIPIYLRPHLKGYESILYELEKKGDERLPVMRKIFIEALNKRYLNCATCDEDIDIGTRNFPWRNTGHLAGWGEGHAVGVRSLTRADFTCVNCGEFVCMRNCCVQCMGEVPEYSSESTDDTDAIPPS